jgi:hypothetical protein
MAKSQPEKLDALIKAWLDEAIRDEVIPADGLRPARILRNRVLAGAVGARDRRGQGDHG